MENMDFGQTSIDEVREISSDMATEISIDDAHQTSIDNTPPESGKYSLTDDANEIVPAKAKSTDDSHVSSIDCRTKISIDIDHSMYERRTKKRFDVGGSSAAPPPPPVRDQYPWPREHEDEPIPPFDHFDDTHKAAKSVACRNRPIVDTRDDYDSIFFNEWLKVSIKPTRFVDPDVPAKAKSTDDSHVSSIDCRTKISIDIDRSMYERRTKKRFDVGGSSAAPPPPPVRDQYPWPREHEDEPIPPFDHFDDTHKAAKSVACRNRPIVDTWDDYESIFFNEWLKVSIEPTRFVDPDHLWSESKDPPVL
ncbi:hypothetical protein F2Q69_00058768 [Brassica cretica]|uniref:Uncharacterized protein n=1 Tax=Brassica cretica TaxID=69181 RepID=A0A8S9RHL9_BRACR|nr:hypothetical protein F2Q69_00058768 [Brassica cretica]